MQKSEHRLAFDAGKTGDGMTKSGRKIDITHVGIQALQVR